MKTKSAEILKDYILHHKLNISNDKNKYNEFTYMDLYRIYSSLEISSLKDLTLSAEDFKNFVIKNIDSFSTDQQHKDSIDKLFKKTLLRIKYYSQYKRHKTQMIFADIIEQLAPSKNDIILDVGAGEMPFSSIFLAQDHPTYSMDKQFVLSDPTLQRLNIHPIHKYFNNQTPVDNFDLVVGRFPCSAIEHIVSQCSKNNKPYFIQLCDCNLPDTDKYGNPVTDWRDILPDIDNNIDFFQDYAFNIDANSQQVACAYMNASLKYANLNSKKDKTIEICTVNEPKIQWQPEPLIYEK